jgi:Ni,Fe-hydrogenase I small subunit
MDILLGSKSPDHRDGAFQLLRDSRICNISLCDDRNPFSRVIVGIAFAFWVNGNRPSLGSIARPSVTMSSNGHVQCDGQAYAELKCAPNEITVGVSFTLIKRGYVRRC